jgi:hypothetical protein
MAGINLSQLNIPKSEEPIRRKHVIRLDELSDAYSNPDKKKESFNNEPVAKGELKKPETKIEKVDRQLKKVEEKTDKLLEKAKASQEKIEANLPYNYQPTTPQVPVKHPIATIQNKRTVSFLTFQTMPARLAPRQILNHVRQYAFINEGVWYSKIDTFELTLLTGKSARDLQKPVRRLIEEGWFEIVETSTSGYRILKINPVEYGL